MNYYLVTTKCGHVGRNSYIPITFAIKTDNGKEAARIARAYPRVKHHHIDAIINCEKVDENRYHQQLNINSSDPYLLVKSKQEQKCFQDSIDSRVIKESKIKHFKKTNKPNLRFQTRKYSCVDDGEYFECLA